MLQFHLDKPFTQEEIDNAIVQKNLEVNTRNIKLVKRGIFIFLVSLVFFYFAPVQFNAMNDKEFLKIIFYYMLMMVGICYVILPFMLKASGIYDLHTLPYKPAPQEKLHDCKAFLTMPEMKEYKHYVDNVQNRSLTNLEADAIIAHWKTLAAIDK